MDIVDICTVSDIILPDSLERFDLKNDLLALPDERPEGFLLVRPMAWLRSNIGKSLVAFHDAYYYADYGNIQVTATLVFDKKISVYKDKCYFIYKLDGAIILGAASGEIVGLDAALIGEWGGNPHGPMHRTLTEIVHAYIESQRLALSALRDDDEDQGGAEETTDWGI